MDLSEFEYLQVDGQDGREGFNDRYKINRLGQLYSCHQPRILRLHLSSDGYLKINLTNGITKWHVCIHRLLALQYIPNPDNLALVDHIDQNKLNNDLSNLRWVSKMGNMRNRKDSLHLKSPEEYEEWVVKKREYKKLKAREYTAKKKEAPSEETPEERESRLEKHRAYCKKSNLKKKQQLETTP